MKQLLRRITPTAIEYRILHSPLYQKNRAKKLATSSKRIDICAAQIALGFHLSNNPPLSGKVCLEMGSGWVLSHALVCHLLGAEKVIATDITHNAYPEFLYDALHKSVISVIRDILSPFEDHSLIRSRLDNLLSIQRFDSDVLMDLGIEYLAPIDFANKRLSIPVDFIYSMSVLEHVPCEDVQRVLGNLIADLSEDGTMLHFIHLEDHEDTPGDPFRFFSISSDKYSRHYQESRGNRIRKSSWQGYFDTLDNTRSEFIYEWIRRDKALPNHIDSSIPFQDEVDLRTSHIGVYTRKMKL